MKLAIDARSLSTRPTGVGQYLMAAVNVWSDLQPDWQFELVSHKPLHAAAESAVVWRPNVRFHHAPPPRLASNGLWWLLSHFDTFARQLGADLLWGASGVLPRWRRLPALLTVHDLVYRSLPGTMSWRSRIAYSLLTGSAIRTADWLWCVSEFTATTLAHHYPRRRCQQIVVGSGLNPVRAAAPSAQRIEDVRQRYAIHDRTLLFVGTLEPRKNLRFLLQLMPRLAAQGFKLLVVGCAGWGKTALADELRAPDFPHEAVHFCDYVPDDDLQALYRAVALFVSTSLMEGFGLPQLEAMSAGLPVVAAANSALPEVVGQGGVLVEGWEAAVWVEAINRAWHDREMLRGKALAAAARHSMTPACAALSQRLVRTGTA